MTKKMTKTALISLVAVLVLAAVCTALVFTGTASAATLSNSGESSTGVEVKYHVEGGWEVEIGAGMTLVPDEESDLNVKVTKAILENGKNLSITVHSTNNYALQNGDDSLAYTLTKDGTPFVNTSKETVLSGINGKSNLTEDADVTLKVKVEKSVTDKAKYSGDYTDTLTFTVTVAQ